jgi:hypothetical protein
MTASSTIFTSSGKQFQRSPLLAPFGCIWSGLVRSYRHVVIVGAGVGVEPQAATIFGC